MGRPDATTRAPTTPTAPGRSTVSTERASARSATPRTSARTRGAPARSAETAAGATATEGSAARAARAERTVPAARSAATPTATADAAGRARGPGLPRRGCPRGLLRGPRTATRLRQASGHEIGRPAAEPQALHPPPACTVALAGCVGCNPSPSLTPSSAPGSTPAPSPSALGKDACLANEEAGAELEHPGSGLGEYSHVCPRGRRGVLPAIRLGLA